MSMEFDIPKTAEGCERIEAFADLIRELRITGYFYIYLDGTWGWHFGSDVGLKVQKHRSLGDLLDDLFAAIDNNIGKLRRRADRINERTSIERRAKPAQNTSENP